MKSPNATVLSSFPPLKGMSKYSSALVRGLPGEVQVEALGFKSMYPSFLYPTNTIDRSLQRLDEANVNECSFMTWYNPLTWVYAGLSFRGRVLHVQWWHFVLTPIFATVMVCARLRSRVIITTIHNVGAHERAGLQMLADEIIFFLSHQFIVHTESNKELLAKRTSKPIHVVPHGILKPDVPLRNINKEDARDALGLGSEDKVILFFGIIRNYKGLDILIETLADVVDSLPHAKLVIAGKPWTGESWETYRAMIEKHGLEASVVEKIGFVPEDEIEPLFVAADVVVFPYKHFDAQSGAASMALSFGKAMIVSNVGGLPELVSDKRAVVDSGHSAQLASAIEYVLSDAKVRAKLEMDSQRLASNLSWETIGARTSQLYSQILGR